MNSRDMNTNAKIIIGFLTGAIIGTVAGLLVAPAGGSRTRKNINKKAKKLVKQLQDLVTGKQKRKMTQHAAPVKNGRASVASR